MGALRKDKYIIKEKIKLEPTKYDKNKNK